MKISSLIPDLTDEVFGSDLAINKIMIRMAERIDMLESLSEMQQNTIRNQEEILQAFRKRTDIEHDSYIIVDSIFYSDPEYKLIRKWIKEEE